MINLKNIPSSDVIMMCELGKLIKASQYAYYIFDEDTIIVYGAQDNMLSSISRIIVPNTTNIRGTLALQTVEKGFFNDFCKTLIPFVDVTIKDNALTVAYSDDVCHISDELESVFNEKKDRLNESLNDPNLFQFSIDESTKNSLRELVTKMRASVNQRMFKIANGYLITVYSGFIPVNKADVLNIDVLSSNEWFLCKYEILKKKAPAPVHVFIKYRRL